MLGGLELSLIFAFFLFKYAIPEAVASVNGKPTARARDKALREEALAKAIFERKLANLPPPPPTVREALSARLVLWIAPTPGPETPKAPKAPKAPKPPKQKGPWRRAWDALVSDAGAQAERVVTDFRFERKNIRRRRAGQPPIVITVYPCLGPDCEDKGVVDHPTSLCPKCTRAAKKRAAAAAAPHPPAEDAQAEDTQTNDSSTAPRFPCARRCGHTVWLPGMTCRTCSHVDEPLDPTAEAAADASPEPSSHRCFTCERNPDRPCPTCMANSDQADALAEADDPTDGDVAGDSPAPTDPIPPAAASPPVANPEPAPGPATKTPAPTDAGDTITSTGRLDMTQAQSLHIDPNARDATGALRCAAASTMFIGGIREEIGKLANNAARGLRGEVPAVRAIRALEADIAGSLAQFDSLVTEHMGHKRTQDELAQDVNLLHAAVGYLDAARRI
jgi:hypothetical protein